MRGADIESFVRFVRDQESVGARELEAVAEEEGADVVRLLTIHGAKGLEFKVVIVADAGRDIGGPPSPDEILALSDGRFGFRMVHPTRGDRRPVFGYEEVRDASAAQERAERLRLYYVAMTRAIDRLIVSGAIDPGRASDRETPIGWVIERLEAADEIAARARAGRARAWGRPLARRASTASSRRRSRSPRAELAPRSPRSGQLSLFGELPAGSAALAPGAARARADTAAAASMSRAGSRTARSRCSTPARTGTTRSACSGCARASRARPGRRGERRSRGDRDRRRRAPPARERPAPRPVPPAAEQLAATVRGWYPPVSEEELTRIAGVRRRVLRLVARAPDRRASRTSGPSGPSRSSTMACSCTAGSMRSRSRTARALVLDYKTNSLGDREPADVIEHEYRLQRLVYALACLRAGATEVEVVYQFLERPEDVVSATFTAPTRRAGGRAVGGDRAHQRRRLPARRRASSRAPAAPRWISSAQGPGSAAAPVGADARAHHGGVDGAMAA